MADETDSWEGEEQQEPGKKITFNIGSRHYKLKMVAYGGLQKKSKCCTNSICFIKFKLVAM